jgi:hypothetical protein
LNINKQPNFHFIPDYYLGPLTFKLGDYNGSLPTLHDNPWAWTQVLHLFAQLHFHRFIIIIFIFILTKCYYDFQGLNIIYLDAPVGAGFSYSETDNGYIMDDYEYVAQVYEFLQKVRGNVKRVMFIIHTPIKFVFFNVIVKIITELNDDFYCHVNEYGLERVGVRVYIISQCEK